jgi:ATP-dependent DNA ligase
VTGDLGNASYAHVPTLPSRKPRFFACTRRFAAVYMDHIEERGEDLFRLACHRHLDSIVANWRDGLYDPNRVSSWIKLKNPAYAQIVGRDELFEKRSA